MTASPPVDVVVLGATGSIGVSTLDVIARNPRRFRVAALTAQSNLELLCQQCRDFRPRHAVIGSRELAAELSGRLRRARVETTVGWGETALCEAATAQADVVVAGIVGAAGLAPTLAAVERGRRVLLANKEALVMAGAIFMDAVRRSGAELLPLDSEHNAIFQCLPGGFRRGDLAGSGICRVMLTASGGPFRDSDPAALEAVTPDQACAHPNWVMGRKISVDSATLMNKGLELVEACWLFGLAPEQIEVVVHPQSVVHSLVEYRDGSVLAQLGNPDMRTPIAHALAYPERIDSGVGSLDLFTIGRLDFSPPDAGRFPCLGLAQAALRAGGDACATLSAANEVAVEAFLAGRIGFMDIPRVLSRLMEQLPVAEVTSLGDVTAADQRSRREAGMLVSELEAGRGN